MDLFIFEYSGEAAYIVSGIMINQSLVQTHHWVLRKPRSRPVGRAGLKDQNWR